MIESAPAVLEELLPTGACDRLRSIESSFEIRRLSFCRFRVRGFRVIAHIIRLTRNRVRNTVFSEVFFNRALGNAANDGADAPCSHHEHQGSYENRGRIVARLHAYPKGSGEADQRKARSYDACRNGEALPCR